MCDNDYYISDDNSSSTHEDDPGSTLSKVQEIIETTQDIAEAATLLWEEYKQNYVKDEDEDE